MNTTPKKLAKKRDHVRQKVRHVKAREAKHLAQVRDDNMKILDSAQSVVAWALKRPLRILVHKYIGSPLGISRLTIRAEDIIFDMVIQRMKDERSKEEKTDEES